MKMFKPLSKIVAFTLLSLISFTNVFAAHIWCFNSGCSGCSWHCYYMPGDCEYYTGLIGSPGSYSVYCENLAFRVNDNKPIVYVDDNNNALLEFNNNRIRIASDEFHNFVKNKINNSNKPASKELQAQLFEFQKKDKGFVSQSTIKKIADSHKAKVVRVKKLPEANYCPACDTKKDKVK